MAESKLFSTSWGPSETLVLRSGGNSIDVKVNIDAQTGKYKSSDFIFWNKWSLKAFCRTADAFVYTTSSGVKALSTMPANMPADYEELGFDYMKGYAFTDSTSKHRESQPHMTFINSIYDFNIAAEATQVVLAVDPNFLITCYDGHLPSAPADMMELAPFPGQQQYGQMSGEVVVPFDPSKPAMVFSTWSLPVFVNIVSGMSEKTSGFVGETYAVASSAANLPTPNLSANHWNQVQILTATWSLTGDLLDFRSRGFGGLQGGFFEFKQEQDKSWTAKNGQQRFFSWSHLGESTMKGFKRTSDLTTVGTFTLQDGPECGNDPCIPDTSATPDGRPCTQIRKLCGGAASTFYYIQLQRA